MLYRTLAPAAAILLGALVLGVLSPSAHAQSDARPVDLTIAAVEGLQYDSLRIAVPPGAEVRLTFENRDEMPHNLVVTLPGRREAVVEAALALGAEGPAVDFVPESPDVLVATPLLDPEGRFTLTFTAPTDPGVYPYVCTFPGHGYVMYGALYVTDAPLPPLETDPNVPPRELVDAARSGHPYPLELPAVYRTFMPDSGPASIAVGLENGLSYTWDAGQSMLRYAWQGGFLSMEENWKGKGRGLGVVLGPIFYRNEAGFPLRIADPDSVPRAQFLGYRLVDGRPEFRYRIGEATVHELITPAAVGTGLDRRFRIENLDAPLWFVTDAADGVPHEASAGVWDGSLLKLTPEQARSFTVTLRPSTPSPAP